jgi:hypothetical protein
MTFLIGVVNSINCQVEPNLHLENFHFPIFLKPAVHSKLYKTESIVSTHFHQEWHGLIRQI